jgi:hypothetical protein
MKTKSKVEIEEPMFKVQLFDVDKCIPYPKNNKLHPAEQIDRLAAAMKASGFDQPIVLDIDHVIIKGHGRLLAAIKNGMTKVPVIIRDDLSKAEADAARISDNITTSTAYDTRAMQEEIKRLLANSDDGLTADMMGLSQKEQDMLLADTEIPDLSVIMNDTHADIAAQRADDAVRVAKSDQSEVKLNDAFGFKTVTGEQARAIAHFVARAEGQTGKVGRDAVIDCLTGLAA